MIHTSLGKAPLVFGLLALCGTLSGAQRAAHSESSPVIRVAQESSPGAGDFDTHILGSITVLHTTDSAAKFYDRWYQFHGNYDPAYGDTKPALTALTAHLFVMNAADGLALFIVYNKPDMKNWMGLVTNTNITHWELSGGKAGMPAPDPRTNYFFHTSADSTVFTEDESIENAGAAQGMVIGPLPAGFTILGQFIEAPTVLTGGWVAISGDGTRIPLSLAKKRRVRLDVLPGAPVHQPH